MLNTINILDKLTEGLNESQKKAVLQPIESCTKIIAGAGTGKTKIISKRFSKLFFDIQELNNPLDRILVITFTDKAAAEMKSRIVNELRINQIDIANANFWISTFHGFGRNILCRHAQEVGLTPDFTLADDDMVSDIYKNIMRKIEYVELDEIQDIDKIAGDLNLNKDILLPGALTAVSKVFEIKTLFDEIFSIIKKIKSLGLTPKEFLEKTLISTKTFSDVARTLPFKAKDKEEFTDNWKRHLALYIDDYCACGGYIEKDLIKTNSIIAQNRSRTPDKWSFASGYPESLEITDALELYITKVCALVYAIFQNEMKKANIVDFDDLINYPVELLKNNEELRSYYQEFFKHIIIDEFQDTSGAQLELVKLLLAKNSPNITFVGDRKQSIYGFRYAQMENIDTLGEYVKKRYNSPITTIQLSVNYRSTYDVLRAVNFVTLNQLYLNEELAPPEGKETNPNDVKHTVLTDLTDGYEHNIKEAEAIAGEILKLKSERNLNFSDFAILVKSHSQADFFYKQLEKKQIPCVKSVNTDFFSSPIVKNIIALFRLAKNIYDEQALIRLLQIRLSDAQIYKLYKYAVLKIKESEYADQVKSMNFCEKMIFLKERGLVLSTEIGGDSVDYLNEIFDLYNDISINYKNSHLGLLFQKLINTIKPYFSGDSLFIKKANNEIKIMERIIAEFVNSKNYISLTELLKYFDKISKDKSFKLPKNDVGDENAVKIMTIHASKGLEFEYLFVNSITKRSTPDNAKLIFDLQYGDKPGFGLIIKKLDDKVTPKLDIYANIWKKPRNDSEDIRLFYVALSRAKQYLNLFSFEKYNRTLPAEYIADFVDSFV